MKINNKEINANSPCYIIAEMSANHGGSFEKAIDIIHAAKACGADAVKLQTYRADTITLNSDKKDFLLPSDNPWEAHKNLYSLYEKAYTPWEWHQALFDEGKKIGIDFKKIPEPVNDVYPANYVDKAEIISNPKLIKDITFQKELKTLKIKNYLNNQEQYNFITEILTKFKNYA